MYYVAVNVDLGATSPKYRFMHEAREAAKRLNTTCLSKYGWIAVSNKPPMTPEQCCPWVKDYKFDPNLKTDLDDV